MKKYIAGILMSFAMTGVAEASEQIRVVGSSTVYPFVTVVAEEFGIASGSKTPIIESTGTGGGFKLFCAGTGDAHPDFSNASRAIKKSEVTLCAKNGVKNIIPINIGYDGIVLAHSSEAKPYDLTKEQLFLALARKIEKNGKLIDNPYKYWNEIDSSLPSDKIEIYGPPPTSGTRDAFVELVMEKSCIDKTAFEAAYPNKNDRKKACHLIREDGYFKEAGENDNLIVQKLRSNPKAFGIFGYSFLDQNAEVIQGSKIEGVGPSFDNIADGSYSISRPLYVYAKKARIGKTKGMEGFIKELVSEHAIGPDGYLTFKGLIPLADDKRKAMQQSVLQNLK